jgi:hypothetical protein
MSYAELLALYGEHLLSTPSSAIEHQIYARTYHCLLTHYPMELAPFFSKFCTFFTKYFGEHMEDNKPSGETLYLSSLPQSISTSAGVGVTLSLSLSFVRSE